MAFFIFFESTQASALLVPSVIVHYNTKSVKFDCHIEVIGIDPIVHPGNS